MPSIHFYYEQTAFKLSTPRKHKQWLIDAGARENRSLQELNFIFCSDSYLHQLNKGYLNHDTLTDVITFDHSESEAGVAGDIFISVDRVRENAQTYNAESAEELRRVMIHGVLHLIGYGDKTDEEIKLIREKENFYLSLF